MTERKARQERGLKKLPDGRWRYSWTYRGRYHRMVAPSYAIAAASLGKIRSQIAENKFLEKDSATETLFRDAVKKFLAWGRVNLRPGTLARDEHFAGFWMASPCFRGKALADVQVADVEAYRNHRLLTVGKRTADYDLSRLRRLFNLCRTWGLCRENPANGVKMFRPDNRRDRYLDALEEKALLDVAPAWLRPVILFSLNTGLRQGELFSLTWGQVDRKRRIVTVTAEKAKGRRTRHVPMNQAAMDALGTQPRAMTPDAPVFPVLVEYRPDSLMRLFRKLVRKANLHGRVTWHTLRHTFASNLVVRGADLVSVKELLGHTTLTMTLRYAHVSNDTLRAAVGLLDEGPNLHETCTDPEEGTAWGGP